jgi:phage virion morphogenesis protein
MPVSLSIDIYSQEVQECLAKIIDATKDQSKPLATTGEIMLRSVQRNFTAEGRPSHWPALAKNTVKGRRKKGVGAKILRDTGKLYASLQKQTLPGEVQVGTSLVYAAIHNFGGDIKQGARPFSLAFRKTRGGGWRFASANTKRKIIARRSGMAKARTIHIPKREFMLFQIEDINAINAVFIRHNLGSW